MTTRMDKIRDRLNAATPGPRRHTCTGQFAVFGCPACEATNARKDQAHADLAWLLDEVERLRAALEVAIARDPWAPVAEPHGVFCECSDCDEDRAQEVGS